MRNSSSLTQAILIGTGALATLAGILSLNAAPAIPGLHRNHPLDEARVGAILIDELRCAACHEGISAARPPSAPDLTQAGSRLNPEFLRKFIEAPSVHDPGTAMPDLLASRSAPEREELASSLSAYLISLADKKAQSPPPPAKDDGSGKRLFHETGCIACHAPQDQAGAAMPGPGNVGLGHVGAKYRPAGLVGFLQEPLRVRPDGRMPDMGLNLKESQALSSYLLGGDARTSENSNSDEVNAAQIAAGKLAFTELRCISCHQVEKAPLATAVPPAPPFSRLDLNRGCLSKSPGKAPDYHLSDDQRAAILSALATPPAAPAPADAIKLRLTQLNCISCHQRDDYGGVPQDLDSYFHSTEEALGNESRLPPPLTMAGAKLRPEWMNKVLYDGEKVRPYMTTRMPGFGPEALEGLTGLFGKVDHLDPFEFAPLDKDSERPMREGAVMLLGDKGLNCIACHNYNGKDSPSMKGLDLMTSYQRLQPAWFNQFLRNPGGFRPGIIMPGYWPDGKAVQTEILNGDAGEQIRSLWYNFSLGQSARDPSGLRSEDPELIVGESARTYRGRSSVAGYRGIAVGFPGGLNYAFNAQTGALSAIWSGKFIRVGWNGQGSGNFTPVARAIELPQDVAFLAKITNPWPLAPQRTKENPVNPDPLYPRQHGYAFQGYSIGDNGVPTFRYRCGEVAIEDSSVSISEGSPTLLRRSLTFQSPTATQIHLRALTGKIEELSATSFQNAGLQLTLGKGTAPATAALRPVAGENAGHELLIRIDLPVGTSTLTIDYAPRR